VSLGGWFAGTCHFLEHLSPQKLCFDNLKSWQMTILSVEETKEFQTILFQCVSHADHFLPYTWTCASQIRSTGTNCEPSFLCRLSTRSVVGCVVKTACKEVQWKLVSSPQQALLCLQEILATNGMLVVLHPPNSADLAHCDLLIFPKLQEPLVREKNMLGKLADRTLYFIHFHLCV
jgi:hypothetical protein